MAKDLFRRYIWLVDTINRAKRITFGEINRKWKNSSISEGEDLPLRTFHNHRVAIEDTFNILIECDKATNEYYIDHPADLKDAEVSNWLLHTVTVRNLLSEAGSLRDCLQLEAVPSGERFLLPIVHAIRERCALQIVYQSFVREVPTHILLDPYLLKLFRHRWYIIGLNHEYQEVRTYALDRVQELEGTEQSFTPVSDFEPDTYFDHCFGIMNSGSPETLIIRVSAAQANYIRSFPLHISQQELHTQADYSLFQYYLKPTIDLLQELLSHGPEIEVISPQTVRTRMQEMVHRMEGLYPFSTT